MRPALVIRRDKWEAVYLAQVEGRRYIKEGGQLPANEEELFYVLDEAFSRQPNYWGSLIDSAGQEAVDAAAYVGMRLEVDLSQ